MHHLFSLLQTLLLIIVALRVLFHLLAGFISETYFTPQGENRVLWVIKHRLYSTPFCVASRIWRSSFSTPHEKARLIILEFLMAFVTIMLLFPIRVLGVPNALEDWLVVHTYTQLRVKYWEIEFSERVLAQLREEDEDNREGCTTNER